MNENLIAYLVAYLLGAIPFGLVLCKIFVKLDIRKEGSHSIGATNVLRVLKQHDAKKAKIIAICVVICDALKGVLPILAGRYIFELNELTLWTMAVLAVIGHCFSPYLKFEGGKGIATGAGVFACFLPLELVLALIVWFFVAKFLKISSLASLAALISMVIFSFILHPEIPYINSHAPILIVGFIVLYKHIPNIKRLITKSENKVI